MADEPEAEGGLIDGGSSRQLIIALAGALAVRSLAQDAREAGGTVAALVVVARAAVLAPQHGVVAHPSCRKHKAKRAGETGGAINGPHGDTPAEDISRCVRRAKAVSSRLHRPVSLKQSRRVREGETQACAARMPIVRPKSPPTGKEDGQILWIYGYF